MLVGVVAKVIAASIPVPIWFVVIVMVPAVLVLNWQRTRSDAAKKTQFDLLVEQHREGRADGD